MECDMTKKFNAGHGHNEHEQMQFFWPLGKKS